MRPRLALVAVAAIAVLLVVPAVGAGAGGSAATASPVGFLTGPNAGSPLDIALAYLKAHKQSFGLTGSDLSDIVVSNQYTDAGTGTTHIYLQQRYKGIGVYNGITDVNVAKDGSVINVGNRFVSKLASAVNSSSPGHGAKQGVKDAAKALGLDLKQEPNVVSAKGGPAQETVFDKAGISLQSIPAKLVYVPASTGVRLAWNVTIYETDAQHWWNANVDAATGDLLAKADYVDNESYNVFAPPKESPFDGGRSLEVNPFDTLASPFGWHDTDGVAGPESTLTIGNNVHAATDLDANNVPDPGSEPDGGPSLLFDFPLDLSTQEPADYRPAAVTNLFFWNNYLHDVSYHYGFTEAAGNFQENDYGRGGLGGDSVNADAQDGSGLNNANFGTPPDGFQPRMQMFVWTSPVIVTLTVNTPAEIAGNYTAVAGNFGPEDANVTGDVALPSGASIGCAASDFSAFPSGDIALIDRGTCTFSTKIRNAQNAGAPAVIVANNGPGLITMAQDGTPNQPTIPAVMITQTDGTTFKAHLPGVNTTIIKQRAAAHNRDSDLDNGVIAHEYTHGISNRLTGGPSNVTCLQNAEEEGEGWSDFMALVLTAKAGQTGTTQRPIGAYVNFGTGIRSFPYTTDISVNPQTYDAIKTNGEVHFTGAVWAEMLWEVYWNLVNVYGFDPNIFDNYTKGGNNLALQLVMDGMKLQPCSPGFVDSRNAILLADQNLTGGSNQCAIWRAFAKRGLGANASQGSSNSTSDGTQDFTVPSGVCYAFSGFFGSVKNPPTLNTVNSGSTVSVVFSLGGNRGLNIFANGYPQSQPIDCTTKAPTGPAESTVTAGGSGLTYNGSTDRYTYPWKTSTAWGNTCRQLIVRLHDSTEHVAYFNFTK